MEQSNQNQQPVDEPVVTKEDVSDIADLLQHLEMGGTIDNWLELK